ncbi:MAG TPA: hypothetical protein DEB40_00050 [Elusimicrobia bacterium]|nr:hypothetical protein [Elusimicrobiota bacterium]HBT60124.1 hypothetical protein [Elusimicrobiota bacterium]
MFQGLKGKVVLITGASGGLGSAMAQEFAARGCKIGLHYHAGAAAARALLKKLPAPGPHAALRADLRRNADCRRLIVDCVRRLGHIDILINNAGALIGQAPVDAVSERSFDEAFALHAKAPFLLSQAAFSIMKRRGGGRIINISSIGVKFAGFPNSAHYAAAKAALESLTLSFARAGAAHNILVNAIRPGVILTPFHDKAPKDMAKRIALIPLVRAGEPLDVARAALYLASQAGSFITGQILPVTGGE